MSSAGLNPRLRDWRGQGVWIVGASSGIGRATAEALAAQGARVVVSARKVAPLQEVAARHAGALALPLDACAPGALVAAMPQVLAHLGRLDLAMYCAGHYAPMRADRLDLDEALRHQDINVGGAWRLLDAVLPALLAGLETHELVIGSRYVPGGGTRNWGLFRRMLSRFGSFYARSILGLRQHDCTTGYRAYRADLLRRCGLLDSTTQGYSFLVEGLYRCVRAGATVLEVPILFVDRQYGKSKLSKAIMFEAALLPWRLRFSR